MRITCVKVVATTVVALTAFCPALGAEIEGRIVSLAAPDGAGLVFCGLDDFPSSVPLGEQHAVTDERVNKNGVEMSLKRRVPAMDGRTLHGRLNALLDGKKKDRSEQSIALVALPGASAEAVLSSGSAWSVPVVNLSEGRTQTGSEKTLVPLSSVRPNDWRGRRVAFLGDSITDARHIGCTSNYWNFLERDLGIVPLIYGINGHQWKHVFGQAEKLSAAHSNKVDEIVIFAGTNDYNANVPLGGWSDGEKSFRGRIAAVMDYCERRFPGVTIWLMTPIHRGYATFGPGNVQPDETYANTLGLWISDYVDVIKEAAAKWRSARLIDLYAESGLYPLDASHEKFFHNARTDMLHPNTAGQERIARTMMRRLKFSNATELVRSCIDALPPEGGTLYFAKDTYHFYEDGSETMWLDPSNNQSGEKRVVFPLAGRRNVTIDGCGSTFVFHGRTFPFAATNCNGLTLRNFTVTTRYPSCAGFTVKEKDSGGFTVKFDEGVCPCKVENGHLTFTLDGCPVSTRDGRFSLHALDRLCISYLMAPESPGDKSSFPASFVGARAEDHGNREVRFSYYGDKHPKCCSIPYNAGERVAVNLEEKRYRDVFFFEDCRDVNVENVSIRRFGGMGVVAQRSGNIKVKGLKVVPPEGERVTLTADILQFINCYGQVSIVDCEGGHSLDDWINIHGNYLKILSVDGRRMRLKPQHPSQQGFFPYRPGDRIECLTAHTRAVTASARVLSVARDAQDASVAVITTDGEIAGRAHAGQLVENATLNPDVTISGNRFVNFPHLRLSGRGKYLVEGNRFQDCQKAVHGMDLADYWFESGRISDMTIRGNEIVNGGGFAFGLSGWNEGDPAAPKIHGRILIENNTFRSLNGEAVSAAGVRELIVKDPSARR